MPRTALRLCLERIVPTVRAREEAVPLPQLVVDGSLADQGRAVLSGVAAGNLTPAEGSSLLSALSVRARLIEADELERHVTELEALSGGGR